MGVIWGCNIFFLWRGEVWGGSSGFCLVFVIRLWVWFSVWFVWFGGGYWGMRLGLIIDFLVVV